MDSGPAPLVLPARPAAGWRHRLPTTATLGCGTCEESLRTGGAGGKRGAARGTRPAAGGQRTPAQPSGPQRAHRRLCHAARARTRGRVARRRGRRLPHADASSSAEAKIALSGPCSWATRTSARGGGEVSARSGRSGLSKPTTTSTPTSPAGAHAPQRPPHSLTPQLHRNHAREPAAHTAPRSRSRCSLATAGGSGGERGRGAGLVPQAWHGGATPLQAPRSLGGLACRPPDRQRAKRRDQHVTSRNNASPGASDPVRSRSLRPCDTAGRTGCGMLGA